MNRHSLWFLFLLVLAFGLLLTACSTPDSAEAPPPSEADTKAECFDKVGEEVSDEAAAEEMVEYASEPAARMRVDGETAAMEPGLLALDQVDVFYGTNRARDSHCSSMVTATWDGSGPCLPPSFYLAEPRRGTCELEVGHLSVTLPPDHETGEIERPKRFLTFELRRQDPAEDIVVVRLRSYGDDYDKWAEAVRQRGKSEAFIYVHGYATSFHEAALRAGQVAADLDFDRLGVPMLFSWPSVGRTKSYMTDYDSSELATEAFNQFLDLVHERTGVERVHVIAHSMGNRVVANALWNRRGEDVDQLIDQLVLAAPDIHADKFRRRFLDTLPNFAKRVTLYVSDKDVALHASEGLRDGKPRAGQKRAGLLSAARNGFDPIDATVLDTDFLSHSYYANHVSMLSDIYCVLQGAQSSSRPLVEPAVQGWQFRGCLEEGIDPAQCTPSSAGAERGPTGSVLTLGVSESTTHHRN